MLEILLLIFLGKKIAAKARDKGRSGPAYVFLLIGLWFGGEISGGLTLAVGSALAMGEEEPNILFVLLGCAIGATIGAMLAFFIVGSLPDLNEARDEDYEDDDERYR